MDNEDESLSFASFYFGNNISPGSLSDRLLAWSDAFADWVDHCSRTNKRMFAPCHLAWVRLTQHCPKMPWEITPADIADHILQLQQHGFKQNTIKVDIQLISSFYRWCATHAVDAACGPSFNPTIGVPKPHREPFEGMQLWSRQEVEQLLELLGRDTSVLGKREKALFLLRLNTGVALHKVRNLRWEHIEQRGDDAYVRWSERFQPTRLPAEVWAAIKDYLQSSGRLDGMQPGKVIFAPLKYPHMLEARDRAEDWIEDRLMTSGTMVASLRAYGKRLGIDQDKLTMNALRTTALRLRLNAGENIAGMSHFTDSQLPHKIIKYHLKKVPPLAPDAAEEPPQVAPPRRYPNRLTGYERSARAISRYKPDMQAVRQVMQEGVTTLDEEIRCLRALMKRLVELGTSENVTLETYTIAAGKLSELVAFSQLEQTDEQKEYDQLLKRWDTMHAKDPEIPSGAQLVEAANQAYGGSNTQQELATLRLVLRNVYRRAEACQHEQEFVRAVSLYGKGCIRLMRMLMRKNNEISIVERYVQEGFDRAFRELRIEYGIEDDE